MSAVVVEPKIAEPGCCVKLSATVSEQDFVQKLNVNVSFIMELYRVVMSSFLLMFVPQKCDDHTCGVTENLFTNQLTSAGFGVNVATFLSFLSMYYYEIRRENKMISLLHVNPEVPSDNESVGNALNRLSLSDKTTVLGLDKGYQRSTYLTMFSFLVNVVLSSIVISKSYLDSKTTTALITNILFMVIKMTDAYAIANTETNVFYSAYLKTRLQYNDIDPDAVVEHKSSTPECVVIELAMPKEPAAA